MNNFDDAKHTLTLSEDGSYTAYSVEYGEHYHSTKDGAMHESLVKHVVPALSLKKNLDAVYILDICFGLGFNTLATLYYRKLYGINTKLHIYSPELDARLVSSLKNFMYPKEFEEFKHIIDTVVDDGVYEDAETYIEVYLGDAREYIKHLKSVSKISRGFDIVYQDAFSPSSNPILWTKEYFADIASLMNEEGILTTYSIAFKTRLALYENGFNIYVHSGENFRDATTASKSKLKNFKSVDMPHKISCNQGVSSLRDATL